MISSRLMFEFGSLAGSFDFGGGRFRSVAYE